MDGITFLDALFIYSLLLSPIVTILLLFFWASGGMKPNAKTQLLGIVILLVLGLLFINSPIIFFVGCIAVILLVVWIFVNRNSFLKGQLTVILLVSAIQIAFYRLFLLLVGSEDYLAGALLCIIPIFSIILLYRWAFGSKKTAKGQVFIQSVFIIQTIFAILMIVISIMASVTM